jgi:hypothetical protein
MPDVQGVTAFQLRDPMLLLVLMKADYTALCHTAIQFCPALTTSAAAGALPY